MSKKVIGLSIVLVLALTMVFAGSVLAEKVHLKFMHRWTQDPDNQFFEDVVKNFEEDHPNVEVDITAISNDPFKEKIKIILGSDKAPDVFFSWPGEFTNRFIRADKVLDLTKYMEAGWKDDFVPSVMEPFKYEGKIYGAPYRLDAKVFVYNKGIFDEVGVETPDTYAELLEVCDKLNEAGHTPIAFGNQHPWAVSHYIGQLNAFCVPEDVYEEDLIPAKGDFAHPGYEKALEKYAQLTPYFNESPNAITHSQARASFLAGNAAMMYLEIIEIPEIMRATDKDFQKHFDVFKMPAVKDGKGNPDHLLGYPEGFVVSANTDHPDLAVEFLKYLTGREAGKMEAKQLGYINGIKNVAQKGEVNDAIYNTTQLVLNTEKMVNWFDSALHSEIWSTAREELQKLTDDVTTAEKAIERIRNKADEVRAQF